MAPEDEDQSTSDSGDENIGLEAILRTGESQLPEGTAEEQVDAILSRPDAEGFVQALDPQVLFRLINEAGFDEAADLIPYASPWQVQVFLDLDCWKRDRFDQRKLRKWIAALVSEASDQKLKSVCRETDPEILAMFFKEYLVVDLLDEEHQLPPSMAGLPNIEMSPDGVYAIAYPEDEDTAALIRQLLDRLYYVDRILAWTLLEAARWELMSAMEEEAYRWRNSRLEEFGYVSRDEALEIYKYVNPTRLRDRMDEEMMEEKVIRPKETPDLPMLLQDTEESEFYILRVLASLDDDELRQKLGFELAAIHNRTLVADGVQPGALRQGHDVAKRTMGYLSIGLEFLSRTDDDMARTIVRTLPLKKVFGAGFSLAWKLQQQAKRLEKRPTLTLIEGESHSLLRDDDAALFDAVTLPRPMYADETGERDIFRTQDQIDDAAVRIGLVAFKQLWLFAVKKMDPGELGQLVYGKELLNEPPTVSFDSIFATVVALDLVADETEVRGLSEEELGGLPAALRDKPWGDDPVGYFDEIIGPVLEMLPPQMSGLATRWLRQTLEWLEDELGAVREVDAPQFFQNVILIST